MKQRIGRAKQPLITAKLDQTVSCKQRVWDSRVYPDNYAHAKTSCHRTRSEHFSEPRNLPQRIHASNLNFTSHYAHNGLPTTSTPIAFPAYVCNGVLRHD